MKKCASCFVLLIILWAAAAAACIYAGSASCTPVEITAILMGKGGSTAAENIVRLIRIPRMISAMVMGGALGVSGYLLQTLFANPIAGPFVLGISSGAKLTVAAAMIWSLSAGAAISSALLIGSAFVGSMISMSFVLIIASRLRRNGTLIISGIMIGYICSAVTELLVTFADDSNIVNLHNWSMGSFSGISGQRAGAAAIVILIASAAAMLMSKQISIFRLGEDYAQSAGMNVRLFRALLVILSSVLSACVTAFAGPVSFVGIAVPHIMRSLFSTTEPRIMLPAVFLGGGIFCMACDLAARTLFAPSEISIGTMTAIFGAPIVISILLSRKNRRGEQ